MTRDKLQDVDSENMHRYKFEKFRIFLFLGMAVFTFAVIALTLMSAGFDFVKAFANWQTFVSDLVFVYVIIIVCMWFALKDGVAHFRSSPSHPYTENLDMLANRAWKVIRMGLGFAFSGFSHKKYMQDRLSYLAAKLQRHNLTDVRILDLRFDQITELRNKPLIAVIGGKEVGFDVLTPEQYLVVHDLKTGNYSYDELPSDYFLSGFSTSEADRYQYYAKAEKRRKEQKRYRLIRRFVFAGIIGFVWAGIFYSNEAPGTTEYAKAILRTVTAITSIISGYIAAKDDVDDEAGELDFKKQHIDQFFSDYNSGVYVPEDLTDIVKGKLAILAKEYNEEAGIEQTP